MLLTPPLRHARPTPLKRRRHTPRKLERCASFKGSSLSALIVTNRVKVGSGSHQHRAWHQFAHQSLDGERRARADGRGQVRPRLVATLGHRVEEHAKQSQRRACSPTDSLVSGRRSWLRIPLGSGCEVERGTTETLAA
jgi:hypothetical protein